MIHRALAALTAFSALAASAAAQSSPVHGIRVWSTTESTRIVVEMTGDFTVTADRALNPERLFFDVTGARPTFFNRGEQSVAVQDRIIRRIRVARWQPTVYRIVLDLEQPVDYTASELSTPDRLIVEVRPAGAAAPAELSPEKPVATRPMALPGTSRRTLPRPVIMTAPEPSSAEVVEVASLPDPTRARERASRAVAPRRAAKISDSGDLSLTRVLGLKVGRVVLDAGHGGHDTGTSGPSGYLEKDLVLDVTQRLGGIIEKRMGSEVIYTRSDDTFIALHERTAFANAKKADLFLSIHANSSPAGSSSGVETFYLNFTNDKYALQVAARENAVTENSVYDLPNLVQQIAKHDKKEESRQFATRMQAAMYSFSVRGNTRARDRGVKSAPFVVLIGAHMPSVLCEIGFLTNARDEALLKRPEYRQKLAEALYRGLSNYASTLSHIQVAVNK
jgi:N-acetylmuramoyl-L-alanine amidase